MLVRGPSLAESMSRYLIDRIEAIENIEVLTQTEIVALSGTPEARLERVRWRHKPSGRETEKPIRNVCIFAGAEPATQWLQNCGVALDAKEFVQTGSQAVEERAARTNGSSRPLPLESSVLGVFAVGDVRSGSVKRVGAAIGEGASVVAQLHTVLANARSMQPATTSPTAARV
jgi:thioredoxin reductase (NADPH)